MKNVEIRIGEGLKIVYDLDNGHLGQYEGKELREGIRDQFIRHELLRIIQAMMLTSFSVEGDVQDQENRLDEIMLEEYLNVLLNNVRTTRHIKEDLAFKGLATKIERMCERLGVYSSSSNI